MESHNKYFIKGLEYLKNNEYKTALKLFSKSYAINKKKKKSAVVEDFFNIMKIYYLKSDLKNLIKWNKIAIDYCKTNFEKKGVKKEPIAEVSAIPFKKLIISQYINIGDLYLERKSFNKANEYFEKAGNLMKNDILILDNRLLRICNISQYFIQNMGMINIHLLLDDDFTETIINKIIDDFQTVINNRMEENNIEEAALSAYYLGILLNLLKKEKEIKYILTSYNLYKQTDNIKHLGRVCVDLGVLFKLTNNLEKSVKYLNEGIEIFEKLENKYWMTVINSDLGAIYLELGNDFLNKASQCLNDSLSGCRSFKKENDFQMSELQLSNLFNLMLLSVKKGAYNRGIKFGMSFLKELKSFLKYLLQENKIEDLLEEAFLKLLRQGLENIAHCYSKIGDSYNFSTFTQLTMAITSINLRRIEENMIERASSIEDLKEKFMEIGENRSIEEFKMILKKAGYDLSRLGIRHRIDINILIKDKIERKRKMISKLLKILDQVSY
ncbi:MAG: hypothetical protein ACTSVC_08500 [Promethearchaeota archaeon]